MGFCVCSMFCYALLCVLPSFTTILMGKRVLVALLCLSSWCLVIYMWHLDPLGFIGWSAVCDCGISRSYSLFDFSTSCNNRLTTSLKDKRFEMGVIVLISC